MIALAISVGALCAAGLYMILRRSVTKFVIGLSLLSHATNLLVFTAAGPAHLPPPIIPDKGTLARAADPLPQALILTAIVINFGLLGFVAALLRRTGEETTEGDLTELKAPER